MSTEEPVKQWPLFLGDCEEFTEFLKNKNFKSPWCILKFLDALFRGFGQVILANNPVSGLIFILALFAVAPIKATVGLIAGVLGIFWCFLIGRDFNEIASGATGYNPILVGFFTQHAIPTILSNFNVFIWLVLVLGVILCIYLNAALDGFLSKWRLPCLTLPFIFIMYLLVFGGFNPYNAYLTRQSTLTREMITSLNISDTNSTFTNESDIWNAMMTQPIDQPIIASLSTIQPGNLSGIGDDGKKKRSVTQENSTISDAGENQILEILNNGTSTQGMFDKDNSYPRIVEISLYDIFHGTLHSACAVIGLNEHTSLACIIFLCLMLFSPIMCLSSFMGALISTLTAAYIIHAPPEDIFNGTWSYNGFLVAAALGGYGFVLTWRTLLATVFAIIFTVFVQNTLNILYSGASILQYNLAFNIGVMSFLLIEIVMQKKLPRPNNLSFPEKERYEYTLVKRRHKRYRHDDSRLRHISVVKLGTDCGLPEVKRPSI